MGFTGESSAEYRWMEKHLDTSGERRREGMSEAVINAFVMSQSNLNLMMC